MKTDRLIDKKNFTSLWMGAAPTTSSLHRWKPRASRTFLNTSLLAMDQPLGSEVFAEDSLALETAKYNCWSSAATLHCIQTQSHLLMYNVSLNPLKPIAHAHISLNCPQEFNYFTCMAMHADYSLVVKDRTRQRLNSWKN